MFVSRFERVALLALTLIAACSSSDVKPRRTVLEACAQSSDCTDGLVCALGSCRASCKEDRDCENGGTCVTDDLRAACQTLTEREEGCDRDRDCPAPLACASDFRCRNLCETDDDCNVLGVTGRVCAEDAAGKRYCAVPVEVNATGVIDVPPAQGKVDVAGGDGGPDTDGSPDPDVRPDDGGLDGGLRPDDGGPTPDATPEVDGSVDGGPGGSVRCDPECGLNEQCLDGVCSPCGRKGQDCCGTFCDLNLTCNGASKCECGAPGLACCGGNTCDGTAVCNASRVCACGGAGEACCPGTPTNTCSDGLACTPGNRCSCLSELSYSLVQKRDGTLWSFVAGLAPGNLPARVNNGADGAPFVPVQFSDNGTTACAVDADGQVWCWGLNDYGQVGNGTSIAATRPVKVITEIANATPLRNVVSVSVGWRHACALTQSGAVYCWGQGANHELGNGYTANSNVARPVTEVASGAAFTGAASMVAGSNHACVRKTDNTVWCWGYNAQGEVNGAAGANVPNPVQVTTLQDRALEVVPGAYSTCARANDRRVYCWGDPGGTGRAATDRGVGAVLTNTTTGTQLDRVDALVAAGDYGFCALRDAATARSVWCWNGGAAIQYLINQFPIEGVADLAGFSFRGNVSLIDASGIVYRNGSAPTQVTCP